MQKPTINAANTNTEEMLRKIEAAEAQRTETQQNTTQVETSTTQHAEDIADLLGF